MPASHPYQLTMPHWPKPLGPEPSGTPAERVRMLLARLGHPERRLPPVVHVGGTKGKGSTVAFLRFMLQAAGYRVHAYTSPHLARFNERIVLAGDEIGDAPLYTALERVRAVADGEPVGFFDATTAAAVLAYADMPADLLILEMGLGGSVDATCFLDAPRLTILTTLSYDHTEIMGKSLAEIASFEAGIFRPGVPCILSYQHEDAARVLVARAEAEGTPLYAYGRHWAASRLADGMRFQDAHGEARLPRPALPGAHQIVNAGNAIAALSALTEFDVAPEAVAEGLAKARWKGRLERMPGRGLEADSELWFDGGHNGAAAEAVALFARQEWADKTFYLIFGTTEGKDLTAMIAPFAPHVARLYAVGSPSEPKSLAPGVIMQAALPFLPAEKADGVADALYAIVRHAQGRPFRALVFGTFYLWLEAQAA